MGFHPLPLLLQKITLMNRIIFILLLLPTLAKAQIITTVAGNGAYIFSGEGGAATAASCDPQGVFVDGLENVYIADNYNNRAELVTPAGILHTIAGTGTGAFGGDGAGATAAELFNALDIAKDAAGNIYIADQTNQRIRKVTTSGIISTFAGNGFGAGLGVGGYSGDGAAATLAELNNPYAVAVDAAGNVYIADGGNHRIRMVNTAGIISTFAGNGTPGFSGDGHPATLASLNAPLGVAVDDSGNVYIADANNDRIRKVNTAGVISTFAGTGTAGYSLDGIPATLSELNAPVRVACSHLGNVYIADELNNRIRKVNSAGTISTFAGNGTLTYGGDGGPATAAQLSAYGGISVDGVENVYIADQGNHRVRKVSGILSGNMVLCAGDTSTFVAAVPTGAWSSSNPTIASVGITSGMVTGVSGGVATITFTGSGGYATAQVTINPLAVAGVITGTATACLGTTLTLADSVTGGIWGVSNSHAIVTEGMVTCITAGIDTVEYSVTNSCGTTTATHVITIAPPASVGIISGMDTVCIGHSITLSDSASGGAWAASSGDATVSSAGVVTGVAIGATTISYTVANACDTATAGHGVYVDSSSYCFPTAVTKLHGNGLGLQVNPNPTGGNLTLFLATPLEETAIITICDLLGRPVQILTIATNRETALKLDLTPGLYVVNAVAGGSRYMVKLSVEQ